MPLDKRKENCLHIINTLDNFLVLSNDTKKEIFEKLIILSEENVVEMAKIIIEYLKKQDINNKENLKRINMKKNNIDEVIDDKKDWKFDDLIINNI